MKNKTLSFLLAGTIVGHTVPAKGLDFSSLFPLAVGGAVSGLRLLTLNQEYKRQKHENSIMDCHEFEKRYTRQWFFGEVSIVNPAKHLAAHEKKLQQELQDFAKKYGVKNTKFICCSSFTNSGLRSIPACDVLLIPKPYYNFLLEMVQKADNQNIFSDSARANLHDPEAREKLNSIEASLHHEFFHLKCDWEHRRAQINALNPIILGALTTIFNVNLNNSDIFTRIMGVGITWSFGHIINRIMQNQYSRRKEEIAADHNIPSDLRLLTAQENFYRERHLRLVPDDLDTPEIFAKKHPNASYRNYLETYYQEELGVSVHPTDYDRAERFKARLAALENSKKS